jgi:hypothetical protein
MKIQKTFTFDEDVYKFLAEHENTSRYLNNLVRQEMNKDPTKFMTPEQKELYLKKAQILIDAEAKLKEIDPNSSIEAFNI